MTKSKIKSKKNTFDVQFKDLTKGEVLALINALKLARQVSPVANDVSQYLKDGIREMVPSDTAQELMDYLNESL